MSIFKDAEVPDYLSGKSTYTPIEKKHSKTKRDSGIDVKPLGIALSEFLSDTRDGT
jgi:hypothetical protein